jgi:ATP/ADP translocase
MVLGKIVELMLGRFWNLMVICFVVFFLKFCSLWIWHASKLRSQYLSWNEKSVQKDGDRI